MTSLTANKAIDAYGGKQLWQNTNYIEAEVSTGDRGKYRHPTIRHTLLHRYICKNLAHNLSFEMDRAKPHLYKIYFIEHIDLF